MSTEVLTPSRIKIEQYKIVSSWHWKDIQNDDCAICRGSLNMPCVSCSANKKSNVICSSSIGACGHCYHSHCLEGWLDKQKTCPLCQKEWKPMSDKKIVVNDEKVEISKKKLKKAKVDFHQQKTLKKEHSIVDDILEEKKKKMTPTSIIKKVVHKKVSKLPESEPDTDSDMESIESDVESLINGELPKFDTIESNSEHDSDTEEEEIIQEYHEYSESLSEDSYGSDY